MPMETYKSFKPGDKYIHYTKYGGVNRGEVSSVETVTAWDFTNKCSFQKVVLLTTKGVRLNLDGSDGQIYLVLGEISERTAEEWTKFIKKSKNKKYRSDNKNIHYFDEN